jgi:hypothetical protein
MTPSHHLQRNSRLGGTLALPLSCNHSLKFFGSTGVLARTSNNYGLVGILVDWLRVCRPLIFACRTLNSRHFAPAAGAGCV